MLTAEIPIFAPNELARPMTIRLPTLGLTLPLALLLLIPPASAQRAKIAHSKTPVASSTEAAHRARMDQTITPVRKHPLSKADADNLRAAIKALRKKNTATAITKRGAISDPVARKIVDWYRLRTGQAGINEYRPFLSQNPHWPNAWLLTRKLERKLFDENDPALTRKLLQGRDPETAAGLAAVALSHLAAGDTTKAKQLAAHTWRHSDIPQDLEKPFLKRLGHLLTGADHKWRLDTLMIANIRWTKSRNARAAIIRRQIPRLSKAEQHKARARLAVFARKKNASALMSKLKASGKTDWGVVFQRIEWLRRKGKSTAASKLMLSATTNAQSTVKPDAWWAERRRLAYEALDDENPSLAYKLVEDAGPLSVNPLKSQQFVAGWIALRYLGKTKAAIKHFKTMVEAADGPLSRSKSAYWLARALEEAGDTATANTYYQQSATQFDTFHGLLSRKKIAPKSTALKLSPPTLPTREQARAFNTNDTAIATVIAHKAKLGRSITRQFLARLAITMQSEAEVAMTAHLSQSLGDTQQALRIGKRAIARGFNLTFYAYPLHTFPNYKPLRTPPETAFLLGIARQESEFNSQTLSGAGARGILQVMPITARHVCRDYKIKCNIKRLMTDESYNTMIASAYTADRMREFGGSYVLGLSGYNAGPGRVRQWIKRFGDPRDGHIDPVDWIERMPFKETRNYAAKVLSNIQIYRARLGHAETALRIDKDLMRAQKPVPNGRKLRAPGAKL